VVISAWKEMFQNYKPILHTILCICVAQFV